MHFMQASDGVNLNSSLLFLCRILNHVAKFFNNTEPHQRYAIFFICVIYECPLPVKLGGGGRGFRFYSVCQSIRLFVHSVSVHSVFGHFSVVLWYIYLKFCIKICLGIVQLRLLSHLTKFCVSYCRKQDLNVLYQVCVFSSRSENQDGRTGPWLAETFSTSSLKRLNGIQRNLTGSMVLTSSTQFVFFSGRSEKQDGRPGLWLADTFSTSLQSLNGTQRNLTRSKILFFFYWVCVFRADRKNKRAALTSDWLRHFRLRLWNGQTEFNETWQEAWS